MIVIQIKIKLENVGNWKLPEKETLYFWPLCKGRTNNALDLLEDPSMGFAPMPYK